MGGRDGAGPATHGRLASGGGRLRRGAAGWHGGRRAAHRPGDQLLTAPRGNRRAPDDLMPGLTACRSPGYAGMRPLPGHPPTPGSLPDRRVIDDLCDMSGCLRGRSARREAPTGGATLGMAGHPANKPRSGRGPTPHGRRHHRSSVAGTCATTERHTCNTWFVGGHRSSPAPNTPAHFSPVQLGRHT